MITSFEVGTVFKIVDRASPIVRDLSRDMMRLDELSESAKKNMQSLGRLRFTALRRNMGVITEQAARMDEAFGATFKSMEGGTDAAIAQTGLLAKSWRDVAKAASEAGAAARVAGRRHVPLVNMASRRGKGEAGARRRGGFGIYGGARSHLPGGAHVGVHGHGWGTAALVGAGVLGYAAYEEAQIEDIAARALMTGQIKVDGHMRTSEAFKRIRKVIRENSAKTGFSPRDVGEAILATERQFGGLSFNKRLNLENSILPYAATEARLKETSLPESFKALVGIAHMTGTYDPKKLPELMREFSYASLITPVKIGQFERALSYSMPILHGGMKMDPQAVMFLTAMAQTAGITNTKSGTWIRSFFQQIMPAQGISLLKDKGGHNRALRQFGLLDSHMRPTWEVTGSGGNINWMQSVLKLSNIMSAALERMGPNEFKKLTEALGQRGGNFGALMGMPQFVEQFPIVARKMANWKGGETGILELLAGSPVQQGRQAWADLENVLLDIGQVALPPLLGALHSFDEQLKYLDQHWPTRGHTFGIPKGGSLGAALGKGMGEGAPWGAGAGAIVGAFGGPAAPMTVPGA
ncbi:MAG: hypothetical protein P8Z80_21210, partial [Pseudolabrys sp.]